jgi:hypothetical protein
VAAVSDWWDWLEKKTAPKAAYERPMPKREEPESQGMTVEESTATDSMIVRAIKFWQR